MSVQEGIASLDTSSSEGVNHSEGSSAAEVYVATRLAAGESVAEILESFNVENTWLGCWLSRHDDDARHNTPAIHIVCRSSCGSNSNSTSDGPRDVSEVQTQDSNDKFTRAACAYLPVAAIAVLVTEWVADRRALAEAEELCRCALRGDLAVVLDLLSGDGNTGSDCNGCSIGSGTSGVPWDAEDRLGVTAGEYALCGGTEEHAQCFAALVNAGANDLARRMDAALDAADAPRDGIETNSTNGLQGFAGGASGIKQPLVTNSSSDTTAVSTSERRSWDYLAGPASYGEKGCLLDAQRMPVMMPWEGALMEAHARFFVGPRVLNVGFGCGLVDRYIQQLVKPVTRHTIVEPHLDVLKEARIFADAVNQSANESRLNCHQKKHLEPLAKTNHSGDTATSSASTKSALTGEATDAEAILSSSQNSHRVVEVLEDTWQNALPTLARGSLDTFFYDTHDEGVLEFLQVARAAAELLNEDGNQISGTGATSEKGDETYQSVQNGTIYEASTSVDASVGDKYASGHRGLFSYWNGMEFHNAFRHAAYCEATRRHMCGSATSQENEKKASPEDANNNHSRNFARVDFVRVPVNLRDEDWRCWAAKGLAYWHLQAYYLPLCWTKSCESDEDNVCSINLKEMEDVDGFEVIPPPSLTTGHGDGEENDSSEGPGPTTGPATATNGRSSAAGWCCARREDLAPWMVEGIQRGAERFGLAHHLAWHHDLDYARSMKRSAEENSELPVGIEPSQKMPRASLEVK